MQVARSGSGPLRAFRSRVENRDASRALFATERMRAVARVCDCIWSGMAFGLWLILACACARVTMGLDFVTALHFSLVTASTLGLGDVVPTNSVCKITTVAIIITAAPLLASFLARLGGLLFLDGLRQRGAVPRITGALSDSRLRSLQSFCIEMAKEGAYELHREGGTRRISPFEFLALHSFGAKSCVWTTCEPRWRISEHSTLQVMDTSMLLTLSRGRGEVWPAVAASAPGTIRHGLSTSGTWQARPASVNVAMGCHVTG